MLNAGARFGSDINFVPAAAVYPTAGGGTSADAAAALNPATNVQANDPNGTSGAVVNPFPTTKSTIFYWLGFLALLLGLVFVARKAGTEEDFRNIKPTFYNFVAVTLTAIVGIVGAKVLAVKFPIPGASNVILAA